MTEIPIKGLRASRFTDLIGNTPGVEIHQMCPNPNVRIFAMLEGHNPDRGEKYMSTPLFDLPVGSLFDKIL